jgi:H+/Cl- antiporter ClcA
MPTHEKQGTQRKTSNSRNHSTASDLMLKGTRYTPTELNARLRFVVGLVLAGILALTMGFMLFGLLFVYQGSELSAVDSEFFKLMSPVVMFLTGTLSGVMIASSSKPDANGNGIPDEEEVNNGNS